MVELEWPPRLRLGDSDFVRLTLIPLADGYTVTTEFPDHTDRHRDAAGAARERLRAGRGSPGWTGWALRFPRGRAGILSPAWPAGHLALVLTPRHAGQQRLSSTLWLRWIPAAGSDRPLRETVAYSRSLDVQVDLILWLDAWTGDDRRSAGALLRGRAGPGRPDWVYQPARAGLRAGSQPGPGIGAPPRPGAGYL